MGLPAQARRLPRNRPSAEPPPPPAPGFFEGVYASARVSDTQAMRNAQVNSAQQDALQDIAQQLIAQGTDPATLRNRFAEAESLRDWLNGWNRDRVLAAAAKRRQADPKAFAGIETDPDRFTAAIAAPYDARYGEVLNMAGRATTTQQIVGGLWAGAAEPENVGTMGIAAGGRTIAETMLRNAVLQARIEAVSAVPRAIERSSRGEEVSAGAMLAESGLAVAGGGALAGLGKGIELSAPRVGDAWAAGREGAITALWDRLPQSVRQKWGSAAKVPDEELPGLAELAIGVDNLTPDERAAIAVMRREVEIDAASPFIADGAGVAANREATAEAMRRILSNLPEPPAVLRATLPTGAPVPRLRGDTAISSGTVAIESGAVLKSRIRQVESRGKLDARPREPGTGRLLSSALGPYQFIESTWRTLYKRRFGATGESDAAILAKRTDPGINELLIDDLISVNTQALQRAGHAADAGNLYLAHFAGPEGARKLLDAEPNVSAASVLGASVIRANPFLTKMSASDVVQWAHGKMGGSAPTRTAAPSWRERLQSELDATEADLARLDGEAGEGRSVAALMDEPAMPGDEIDIAVLDAPAQRPLHAGGADRASVELLALVPPVRAVVRDRGRSLAQIDRIAGEIGASAEDVRSALQHLVALGELRRNRKTGHFMRPPVEGPIDVLKWIARRGGLHPSGARGGGPDGFRGHGLGPSRMVNGKRSGGRDMDKFIPGGGPLLRESGMGLDEAADHLWSEGYFRERPTEAELLNVLEDAVQRGRKFYPIGDEPELPAPFMDKDGWQAGELEHYSAGIDDAAELLGLQLTDAERVAVARIRKDSIWREGNDDGPIDPEDALIALFNREAEAARWDALVESDEIDYEAQYDAIARRNAREGGAGDEGSGGPAPDGGDARAQRAGGGDGPSDAQLGARGLEAFDDPHGSGADLQIESVEHDVRASLDLGEAVDPATAARQRQQAQLKADSPMQARVDQDSTIGAPLFDAADQFGFRIDGEGGEVNPADLLAEFDAEDAALKIIKDCL